MLRLLLVLLLTANGLYFGWAQGYFAGIGWAPHDPSEPQRVAAQIKPESLTIITAKEAQSVEAQSRKPVECLQSEVLTDAQATALRAKIESAKPAWPASSWSLDNYSEPPSWMIYMGPFPSAQAMDKKRDELKRMGLPQETVQPAHLGPGLLLAQNTDKSALEKQLAAMAKEGVRTARIVPMRTAAAGRVLKITAPLDELRQQMAAITPGLPQPFGAALHKCPH
jgi:hypothetical protein